MVSLVKPFDLLRNEAIISHSFKNIGNNHRHNKKGPRMNQQNRQSGSLHHIFLIFLLTSTWWRSAHGFQAKGGGTGRRNHLGQWDDRPLGRASNLSSIQAHKHMSLDELRRIFQVEHLDEVPEYEIVKIHSVRHFKRDSPHPSHRVNLETHGRRLQLDLDRVHHLVPPRKPVEAWYADAAPAVNVTYTPTPPDEEDIGDVYQDEINQAAMLLYKDRDDDALLMDGTIGDELVVKPISSEVRRILAQRGYDQDQEEDLEAQGSSLMDDYLWPSFQNDDTSGSKVPKELHDDYAFLDEDDDDLEDEDVKVRNPNRVPLWRNSRRSRRSETSRESDVNADLHIVYKRKDSHLDHQSDFHYMETDSFPTRSKDAKSRRKRQAPYMIFPEILCIVDYDGYRLHGKDNIAIKRYVISFWNGIDLRYKLLKGPSVKISIAGIIISRGRDATPYLERNRVGRDAIDSASALTDMGKYLFLERRLPVYDIAVAITKLDMCRRKSRLGECNRGTAGFAYVGGACVVNKRLEKVNSVAIVEDTGGFSGIIVAAHELGHLLGAVHDGSPPPSYLGGPGANKCRWEDGFIMSDLRHTSKGFRWSHCTVKQFHHFLNGETATCMYNSPHEEEPLPRVLPGKLLSLDAQCRKDRGTSACFKDDRVCAQLFCFDAASGYCVSYRPAAEGSRCGDGFMCLNGKCVLEHENSVDYAGDGFLRRSSEGSNSIYSEAPSNQSPRRVRRMRRPHK